MGIARDQRIANEATAPTPGRCMAHGCPLPWSLMKDGRRCCSAHARAHPKDWPAITEWIQDREADYAYRASLGPVPPKVDKAVAREKLRHLKLAQIPPKQWALDMRERERDATAKPLTRVYRTMWRAAVPAYLPEKWVDEGTPCRFCKKTVYGADGGPPCLSYDEADQCAAFRDGTELEGDA